MKKAHILVRGLVQGVGFRPFIYRIAIENHLNGYVANLGDAGVEIIVEGSTEKIDKFINDISVKKPNVARIDSVETTYEPFEKEYQKFSIAHSDEKKLTVSSVIPTDLSICDVCITDISHYTRWHEYPFTSCAQCGPRFTIIEKLPYDKDNTSMKEFPFCKYCQSEYDDPNDRRYDAQGITCPFCGPKLKLFKKEKEEIQGDPIKSAARLLKEGSILAIKGIGGFHIAVDATNDDVITKLRNRRNRPYQPFAIMSYSIKEIKKYSLVSETEEKLLTNLYHPIVTLRQSEEYNLSKYVSPGLDTVGVMLPYTGIHYLLLKYFDGPPLIMTSGNYPGKPIIIDNAIAFDELSNIADYFLIHNRKIVNRCDDSVIKVVNDYPIFLRKSRGYSPSTIVTPWDNGSSKIMAVGGEFNVTGSIFVKDRLITTQHIGDANEFETIEYLKKALNYIQKIYDITRFNIIAHDLNPIFSTTRLATELASEYHAKQIPVQHHHSHLASLMVDHGLTKNEDIVFIAIDGVGYGDDNMAWGGEILVGSYDHYIRAAQLKYQPMPGGDICAYYPARMLASILSSVMSDSEISNLFNRKYVNYLKNKSDELDIILKQVKNNNILKTSSMGRLLDSIAVLLDVCHKRTYEGEPPMRLESLANCGHEQNITLRLPISQNHKGVVLNTSELLLSIIENMSKYHDSDIAYEIHSLLGKTFGEVACSICDEYDVENVGIGGGSAVNSLLFRKIKSVVEKNNKNLMFYRRIPCGDGGISCGQALVASAKADVT